MTRRRQRGASLLLVLVLLAVTMLGGLAMARMTEAATLIAGNVTFKDSAAQASEVGINEAFERVRALTTLEQGQTGWYFPTKMAEDAAGLPQGLDWSAAPQVQVGSYQVRYVVERLCQGPLPVVDMPRQCVVQRLPQTGSAKAGAEALAAPSVSQYRITVSVAGPKETQVFAQVSVVR